MRPTANAQHALGRLGEEVASAHLRRLGLELLDRGARTPEGEIDVVAYTRGVLVFVEVKTRRVTARASRTGLRTNPLEAIDARKRARIRRASVAWLSAHPARPRTRRIRFDAIGVTVDGAGRVRSLEHLEDVF